MREYDRHWAPHPWQVSPDRVAADCQWSLRGLVVCFPGWKVMGNLFGGTATDLHVFGKPDPFHPYRLQRALVNSQQSGGGYRGSTYGFVAGTSYLNGPQVAVSESHVPGFPTSAGTVMLHYHKLDATNRTSSAFGHAANTPASYLFADLPNAAGDVRWIVGNGVTSVTLTTSGLTFGDDVWAFTWGTRGMELWQNGILRNSNGSTPTRATATTMWGLGATLGVFNADNAEAGCCLLYNRQLEVPEIQELTTDPWTPVRPARRVRYGALTARTRAFVPGFIG